MNSRRTRGGKLRAWCDFFLLRVALKTNLRNALRHYSTRACELVGDEGLEESPKTLAKDGASQFVVTPVVTSGAITDDLQRVIETWHRLDEAVRERILVLIREHEK